MIDILYEDKYLVICVKPVGLLSQGENDNSLVSILKNQLNHDVYPVHRLDQAVSGLMVYAKNSNTAGKLSGLITNNHFEKEYYCIINGLLDKKEDVLEDLLFHDKRKNKTYVVDRLRNGVKTAKLSYTVLKEIDNTSLLRVHLYTGRTHQIRVQFASRKHPLIGDGKYGDKTNKNNIALYSCHLTFKHPITNKILSFDSVPDAELWKSYFNNY